MGLKRVYVPLRSGTRVALLELVDVVVKRLELMDLPPLMKEIQFEALHDHIGNYMTSVLFNGRESSSRNLTYADAECCISDNYVKVCDAIDEELQLVSEDHPLIAVLLDYASHDGDDLDEAWSNIQNVILPDAQDMSELAKSVEDTLPALQLLEIHGGVFSAFSRDYSQIVYLVD